MTSSHNYYLAITRPDGRPHVMPVWGVWLANMFYFSTGVNSRKSRNLSVNPNCAVIPEKAAEAVILEGNARRVKNRSELRRVAVDYKKKYDWDMSDSKDPVYRVTPALAFGIAENPGPLRANPTRWIFGNPRKIHV
ncbi:MAG TPA: pyridoxamine 5'-phosphate oxidase family protein [Candidatus Bathyarchaeia archaeon]|nr:pyridoxamine 5'-phosphate oxidase family protein [Candidatus Bathyarchaeia archaeon]